MASSSTYSGSSPGVSVIARSSPPRTTVAFTGDADALGGHQPLEVVGAGEADAVELDEQVLGAHAGAVGRRALDDLDDLDGAPAPEAARDARRQRPRADGDAEPGAAHAARRPSGRRRSAASRR